MRPLQIFVFQLENTKTKKKQKKKTNNMAENTN